MPRAALGASSAIVEALGPTNGAGNPASAAWPLAAALGHDHPFGPALRDLHLGPERVGRVKNERRVVVRHTRQLAQPGEHAAAGTRKGLKTPAADTIAPVDRACVSRRRRMIGESLVGQSAQRGLVAVLEAHRETMMPAHRVAYTLSEDGVSAIGLTCACPSPREPRLCAPPCSYTATAWASVSASPRPG